MTGGVHGNEPGGVECLLATIEEVSKNPTAYSDMAIDFVPLINPWGWSRDVRENGEWIDPNREFLALDFQESRALKRFIERKRYGLVIDHHQDGRYGGFYALTYDNPDPLLARQVARAIQEAGFPVRSFKGNDGFIFIDSTEMVTTRLPTFSLFARLHVTANAFILETPFEMAMKDQLRMYAIAHQALLDNLRHAGE